MHFDGKIEGSSQFSGSNISKTPLENITKLMNKASETQNLDEKRNKYNEAYKEIIKTVSQGPDKLTQEIRKEFFKLIEAYASSTCYNQGEGDLREEGFRKSAHLCEFLICQMFQAMKFEAPDYEWEKYADLESLTTSLEESSKVGEKTIYKGKFYDFISHITADERALAERASNYDLRKTLTQTFVKLAFSLQNIDNFSSASEYNYQLHNRLNDITETLINDGTHDQKYQALFYAYNRCGFMVDLKMPDEKEGKISPEKRELKMKNYVLIEQKIREVLGDHPDSLSIVAQVKNQKGLLSIDNDNPKTLPVALPYFKEALAIRKPLLEVFKDNPSRLIDQNGLYANAINGAIHCLVKGEKVTEGDIAEAKALAEFLQKHLDDLKKSGDQNTHKTSWQRAINKVAEAIPK